MLSLDNRRRAALTRIKTAVGQFENSTIRELAQRSKRTCQALSRCQHEVPWGFLGSTGANQVLRISHGSRAPIESSVCDSKDHSSEGCLNGDWTSFRRPRAWNSQAIIHCLCNFYRCHCSGFHPGPSEKSSATEVICPDCFASAMNQMSSGLQSIPGFLCTRA